MTYTEVAQALGISPRALLSLASSQCKGQTAGRMEDLIQLQLAGLFDLPPDASPEAILERAGRSWGDGAD